MAVKKAVRSSRVRRFELNRDVNVLKTERPDQSRFIWQRIAWIVVQRQVDHDFEAGGGDRSKLRLGRLAGSGQQLVNLADIVDVVAWTPCFMC